MDDDGLSTMRAAMKCLCLETVVPIKVATPSQHWMRRIDDISRYEDHCRRPYLRWSIGVRGGRRYHRQRLRRKRDEYLEQSRPERSFIEARMSNRYALEGGGGEHKSRASAAVYNATIEMHLRPRGPRLHLRGCRIPLLRPFEFHLSSISCPRRAACIPVVAWRAFPYSEEGGEGWRLFRSPEWVNKTPRTPQLYRFVPIRVATSWDGPNTHTSMYDASDAFNTSRHSLALSGRSQTRLNSPLSTCTSREREREANRNRTSFIPPAARRAYRTALQQMVYPMYKTFGGKRRGVWVDSNKKGNNMRDSLCNDGKATEATEGGREGGTKSGFVHLDVLMEMYRSISPVIHLMRALC